jgi:F0F1-type ATP synthase assembly protein I
MLAHKTHHEQMNNNMRQVVMMSAWGFTMVVASFLFLYLGHLVDGMLGTTPNFMLGFFILGIFLCMMRMYREACEKRKDV